MTPYSPWIALAAARRPVVLRWGRWAVLVGVKGGRARVEYETGRRKTVDLSDIVWVDS